MAMLFKESAVVLTDRGRDMFFLLCHFFFFFVAFYALDLSFLSSIIFLSLFSLSLADDSKRHTRIDESLWHTINIFFLSFFLYLSIYLLYIHHVPNIVV